jgi:hypothetical protein
MPIDLERELGGALGTGAPLTLDEVEELLLHSTSAEHSDIEEAFSRAGWYARDAEPYEPPDVPADAPPNPRSPVVNAERRLWIARYNPADPDFDFPDINDDGRFPWTHPEMAPHDGWWLSTLNTPRGAPAIAEISTGDLVVCQRTDPGPGARDASDHYRTDMLVGVCVIGMVDSWDGAHTGRRERRACLVPLAKFKHPVPRRTARSNHRLTGASFAAPRQLPKRCGPIGRGLSTVDWDDAVDLLSLCGIPPEALAEPNTARLAARLRASETGSRLFLRLRYDAVLRDRVRRVHERQAEHRAEAWATEHGYLKRQGYQHVANAGFDILFMDANGRVLQVEVKGYSTRRLASVHLQPSQDRRAQDAAAGNPPDWRLFALLGAGSNNPVEYVLDSSTVVGLVASGGLQVKRPIGRPGP